MRPIDLALDPRPAEPDETPSGDIAEWLRLPVFPLQADKKPSPGSHGFKDAIRDPAAIRALWRRYPGPLVGVATGAVSGIAVLDIDVKDGARGMEWFEPNRDRLPETRVHRTQSGGLHVLFRHHEGLSSSQGRIAPGVDVRADGGYAVWWPLERFQARGDLDNLADWPEWLLPSASPASAATPVSSAETNRQATSRAIAGVLRTVATAPIGERNAVTYWGAHRLREAVAEGKITAGLARDFLLEAAARAGLPAREASLTINSAMRGSARGQ